MELNESQAKVYRCATCPYQARYRSKLRQHEQIHLAPEERQMFACTYCATKFTAKNSLQRHLENKHMDSRAGELNNSQKEVYGCGTCGLQTLYRSNLRRHKKVHLTPEEPQMFACTHCDQKYITKHDLENHLEDNHMDSSPTDTALNNESISVEHVKQENNILEEDINGSSDNKLELSKDAQKNIRKCTICGYQTRKISHFERHQEVHMAPEERQMFPCAQCGKKYASKEALKRHLLCTHMDFRSEDAQKNIHQCTICGYQTLEISHLGRHQKIHLTPEERQMFACAHCGKKYTTKYILKCHLAVNHLDSRPKGLQKKVYRCALCDYETLRSACLRQHKKVHLAPGERQMFACELCDKKYTSNRNLQDHIRRRHINSRNAGCTSPNYEVVLDSLKIEMDELDSLLDETKSSECISATNEIKSEDFIKTEPDVTPIMKRDMHDDFKNIENVSATEKVKLEKVKMEPDAL
ncbi:zinc finger protein 224-like [Sitophilus oryzae]|uniref:Zinc finger protein 224-like n=1 Tax=Sitophilus oryzae TaxID=7048 RepID=A0A6J2XN52_SITOR|nr:zinc finger protein 224-like [Sitophilus oryzae]XP_030752958.1 zinc finger protein 224-like [Sitophilus oryzae]XP_030752959.1 zinc finger protein 224-like [Sitophilus oryzae]